MRQAKKGDVITVNIHGEDKKIKLQFQGAADQANRLQDEFGGEFFKFVEEVEGGTNKNNSN